VSEDFELMIHFYNLGFNGRYVNYPDCEFEEGITRTFDEEAGRHRKFSLGAHELMFNPFNCWVGQGIFSPLFQTFLRSDIPSYYKIFLTAYLFGYTSGGTYLIVFTIAAITRLVDKDDASAFLSTFSSAGVLVLSVVIYYVIGYATFLFTMVRMKWANNNIFFPEYRSRGTFYLVYRLVRYCMFFQMMFYTVMGNYFFLGSMDHMLSRAGVVSATNKDSIKITRCNAFCSTISFNSGSWAIAAYLLVMCYLLVVEDNGWDFTKMPDDWIYVAVFAAPAALLAVAAFIIPLIMNPFILGWPFNPPLCRKPVEKKDPKKAGKVNSTGQVVNVGLDTFMDKSLDREINRAANKPDVELGSLCTKDLGVAADPKELRSGTRRAAQGQNLRSPNNYLQQQRSARNRNGNADSTFRLAAI
jgi:hypothetical protein